MPNIAKKGAFKVDLEFDLEIECDCGKTFDTSSKNIGKEIQCPYCKQTIYLKDDNFTEELENAEKQIDDFLNNFKL